MPSSQLSFVSSNDEKFREIRGALADCPIEVVRVMLDLPEIQTLDAAEVAAYKARAAHERLQSGPVLVEDTSLGLLAWHGYPGALIKWVLSAVGEEGLCRQLDAWPDRRAVAQVVLGLGDGHEHHLFMGEARGQIVSTPRGTHGFGWDSIFQPEGSTLTYGEMPRETKMQISMRARALAALRAYLLGVHGAG